MKTTQIALICLSIFFLSVNNDTDELVNYRNKINPIENSFNDFKSKSKTFFKSLLFNNNKEIGNVVEKSQKDKPLNYDTYWIEMYGSRFF